MEQLDLIEHAKTRALLDDLLEDSRLYKTTSDYRELMAFVIRLRNFAPFNAMLLQVQRPGLRFAASRKDWRERFDRSVVEDARPLLIMWPFGPVALVYDVADTRGGELPRDVAACFRATGAITEQAMSTFQQRLLKKGIAVRWRDWGDAMAGQVRVERTRTPLPKSKTSPAIAGEYRVDLNKNHLPPVQFVTLAHELGHLYLGHLGPDQRLNIPRRELGMTHAQVELEAESVAYLVCQRAGAVSESQTYLSHFLKDGELPRLDIYQVMRAAGQVEAVLGLIEKGGEFAGPG
jgi:hypothetical protein